MDTRSETKQDKADISLYLQDHTVEETIQWLVDTYGMSRGLAEMMVGFVELGHGDVIGAI